MNSPLPSEKPVEVLSVYDGFFMGGARIVHTAMLCGLKEKEGMTPEVLSLSRTVWREQGWQNLDSDVCYADLKAVGIAVQALDRDVDTRQWVPPFTAEQRRTATELMGGKAVVLSLKEQPLELLLQLDSSVPIVVTLYRSDPENQGQGLRNLIRGVDSGRVALCIIDSEAGRTAYGAAGIPIDKLITIADGTDLDRFKPSTERRAHFRQELEVSADSPIVLLAARYDPEVKGIDLFLEAAAVYLRAQPDAHVVMAGTGMSVDNAELTQKLQTYVGTDEAADNRFHLLGTRTDMEVVYAGADVVALTSRIEGRPLSLMEGGLCGAIPVSTDVGDVRDIIRDKGLITSRNPEEVAAAWVEAVRRKAELTWTPEFCQRFDQNDMIAAYADAIRRALRLR